MALVRRAELDVVAGSPEQPAAARAPREQAPEVAALPGRALKRWEPRAAEEEVPPELAARPGWSEVHPGDRQTPTPFLR